MDVFDLFATLTLDSSKYEEGLSNAETKGAGFGKGLASAAKVGTAAIAAVGTAAVAAGSALVKGTGDVAAYGDNIDKMSQKMGISAKAYQEWDAVLQHSGTSIDSMSRGMMTLQKNAANSADKFKALGLSQEQVASMSTEELFSATITGLQNMEEGAERTALASELLGGSAKELGALLNTSAEETQVMKDRVNELGGVMSDDAVKAAAAFQDQLQDMQTGFDGLRRNLLGQFMPGLTTVMGGLTEIFSGNYDEGLEKISDGIEGIVDKFSDILPRMLEVGVGILESLATAILENIPTIMPALVNLVMSIGSMIIDNLPLLIETGMQVILQIALGIAEALPELIPQIVDVVITIAETLIDNVDLLIDSAIALITGLAEGIINALPILIEKAPEIVLKLTLAIIKAAPKILTAAAELIVVLIRGIIQTSAKLAEVGKKIIDFVKGGFMNHIGNARSWGRDMIQNFIDGVLSKWNDLKNTVSNVASTVKSYIGFSEPELGPLSDFHTFAPDMMELFAKGIADNTNLITDQISKSFNIENAIKDGYNNIGQTSISNQPVNVTVVLKGDAEKLFTVLREENRKFTKSTGVSAFA